MLATTGDDGALRVWDPGTGEELATFREPDAEAGAWGPSFSPDGTRVAVAWPVEGLVRVGDVSTGEIVTELGPLPGPSGASFSPEGDLLAVPLFGDHSVPVVDATSGAAAFTLEGHDSSVNDVAWSPDGRWIATAADDLTARVWDAETGDLRYSLHGHSGAVRFTDWSPDSTRLVTGSEDGTAKVWQITDAGAWELLTLSGWGTQGGSGVAFSPDGERVMAGNAEIDAVQIWDIGLSGDAEWANVPANPLALTATAFTPGGGLIVGNDDGSVTVRDPETGRELLTTEGHSPPEDQFSAEIFTVAANPDGTAIAVARGDDPHVTVWDAATGREMLTVDEEVNDVAWSPDGALLALSGDGGATIVDRSGAEVAVLPDPGYPTIAARFSPDGRLLATARDWFNRPDIAALHVRIWNWERAETVDTIETWAVSMAFSPDGTRIATGHPRGFAEIWDIRSGERLMTLAGHTGLIADLAYSPDGSRIATASMDSTVRLWDAETGVEILALRGHESVVSDVAFSPDGSKLASAGPGLVRVWALDLNDLIAIADTKVTRTLTDEECRQYLHAERCPDT
jgi:WD40 repeat protein